MYTIKTRGRLEGELLYLELPYEEEHEKEAQLFFPRVSGPLRVKGRPFTHLKLGAPIEVQGGILTIELVEGEGDFSLHLVIGPPMEGDHWILCIKSLRRRDRATLRIRWSQSFSS